MSPRPHFLRLPATILLAAATGAAQSSTVNVQVSNQINPSAGVNGRLQLAMSTSFQLANWSYQFFNQTPAALKNLGALQPQHTRVQLVPGSDPLTNPGVWDFSQLDRCSRRSRVPATTVRNSRLPALRPT